MGETSFEVRTGNQVPTSAPNYRPTWRPPGAGLPRDIGYLEP